MKTVYIVLGLAAVGGAVWYVRNKNSQVVSQATPGVDPAAATGVIPKPADSATKVIVLPSDLLQPSAPSGNSGINPPPFNVQKTTPVVSSIAPASVTPAKVPLSVKTSSVKVSTVTTKPATSSRTMALKGLGNPYILN